MNKPLIMDRRQAGRQIWGPRPIIPPTWARLVGWTGRSDRTGREGDRGTWERLEKIIVFLNSWVGVGYQECSAVVL